MTAKVKICNECDRRAYAKGRCQNHYAKWRTLNGPRCIVEDCKNVQNSRGLCTTHRERMNKYGQLEIPAKVVTTCTEDGCERRAGTRDLCLSHYQKWYHENREPNPDMSKFEPTQNYPTAHARVRRARGAASRYPCIDNCGKPARDWSLKHDASDISFGPNRPGRPATAAFSNNVWDYEPRCGDCHKAYDALHELRSLNRASVERETAVWAAMGIGYERESA